jgi:hypothetical protein
VRAYTQVNKSQTITLLDAGDVRAREDQKQFDELHSSIPNLKIIITGYVSNYDLASYYSVMEVLVYRSLRDSMREARDRYTGWRNVGWSERCKFPHHNHSRGIVRQTFAETLG